MAKSHGDVALLKKGLKDNNIISIVRKTDDFYELLVPSLEVGSAHSVIIDTEMWPKRGYENGKYN